MIRTGAAAAAGAAAGDADAERAPPTATTAPKASSTRASRNLDARSAGRARGTSRDMTGSFRVGGRSDTWERSHTSTDASTRTSRREPPRTDGNAGNENPLVRYWHSG